MPHASGSDLLLPLRIAVGWPRSFCEEGVDLTPYVACSGSLSRGFALTRIVIVVVAAMVIFFAVRSCFPSREERLRRFIDKSRDALVEGREEEFMSAFDPAVRYQATGGLAEIRRDWRRYRAIGVGQATVTKQVTTLDATGADVQLDAVLTAGLRPIAQAAVTMRVEDRGGEWHVTTLSWR